MGIKVKWDPSIVEVIVGNLQSIEIENLDEEIKTRLIRNVIRGVSFFTVLFECKPEIFVCYWVEATEAEDFDMSLESRDLISKMTGSSFRDGCRELELPLSQWASVGLVPEFVVLSNTKGKKNLQYEFLTRAWRVAAETFVVCQK